MKKTILICGMALLLCAVIAAPFAVRAGVHCAPAVHAWLGTLQSGAIRFSPGLYNTAQEMDDTALLLARLLQA